jgi:hypothetical protein
VEKRSLPLPVARFPRFGHNSSRVMEIILLRSMASVTLNFPRAKSQNAIQGFPFRFSVALPAVVLEARQFPASEALAHIDWGSL